MRHLLHHLFLPHESNNQKAKILHPSAIYILILGLFTLELFVGFMQPKYESVLGVTNNVSISELVSLTNQKRTEAGLSPLSLNASLSQAAAGKAQDMFIKNYWSHNAPDGTTPWVFIRGAGYNYTYAGENLARGFSTASDVVNAWMASPGHRDNILSKNYSEVGFAVQTGTLTGDETVLVVEMFGFPQNGQQQTTAVAIQVTPTPQPTRIPTPTSIPATPVQLAADLRVETPTTVPPQTEVTVQPSPSRAPDQLVVASVQTTPLIDTKDFSVSLATIIVGLFLLTFAIDTVVVEKRNIIRFFTHNIDHVLYLTIILFAVIMMGMGAII